MRWFFIVDCEAIQPPLIMQINGKNYNISTRVSRRRLVFPSYCFLLELASRAYALWACQERLPKKRLREKVFSHGIGKLEKKERLKFYCSHLVHTLQNWQSKFHFLTFLDQTVDRQSHLQQFWALEVLCKE